MKKVSRGCSYAGSSVLAIAYLRTGCSHNSCSASEMMIRLSSFAEGTPEPFASGSPVLRYSCSQSLHKFHLKMPFFWKG